MHASSTNPTATKLVSTAHKNWEFVNTAQLARNTPYYDREEAGEFLARSILLYLGDGEASIGTGHPAKGIPRLMRTEPMLVIGLCRGGVPIARTVARILRVPFAFLVVRKLSSEANPELAIGALAECGWPDLGQDGVEKEYRTGPLHQHSPRTREPSLREIAPEVRPDFARSNAAGVIEVLNRNLLDHLPDADAALANARERETTELRRRVKLYRAGTTAERLRGRRVILADDGAATGATMRAAIASARKQGASEVIVALPVAPEEVCGELGREADTVICPWKPAFFISVGSHYTHFPQVDDEQICDAIQRSA